MKGLDQVQIGTLQKAMSGSVEDRLARASANVKENYTPKEVKELKEQSAKFEAMVLKIMLDAMRKTVQESDLFGDPSAPSKTIYRSMLDSEYAGIMSKSGTLGLGNMVLQHFGISPENQEAHRMSGAAGLADIMPSQNLKKEFIRPTLGRLSSPFGMREHPITGRMQMHEGVDIAVPKGTAVRAAADGVVEFAGRQRGYGNVVIVKHSDGYRSLYAHLNKINVEVGDTVAQGRRIADSGNSGVSTGPHLHFEIQKDGRPVNPVEFVSLR